MLFQLANTPQTSTPSPCLLIREGRGFRREGRRVCLSFNRLGIKQMNKEQLIEIISARNARSAWDKATNAYALELLKDAEEGFSSVSLLNGAENWKAFSYGGCSLIYNADIAERVCSPSELKRTRGGERAPNSRESWLDCQARCLSQAANLISTLSPK